MSLYSVNSVDDINVLYSIFPAGADRVSTMTTKWSQEELGSDTIARDGMVSVLVRKMMGSLGRNQSLDPTLHSYSTETLQRLSRLFEGKAQTGDPWNALRSVISQNVNWGRDELIIVDLLDSVPFVRYFSTSQLRAAFDELNHYRENGWVPKRTSIAEDQRFFKLTYVTGQIIATLVDEWDDDLPQPSYVPVNTMNWGAEDSYRVITDPNLISFICRHIDEHEHIVSVVKSRSSAEMHILEALMESEAPAVSEGYL